MGNRNYDQNPYLAGEEGQRLVETAKEKKKHAHDAILKVYELVPPEFHKHIRLLSQKEKLIDKQFTLTEEHKGFGLQSYYGKTYVETFKPYFDVEGRIEQMIAVHKEHSAKYTLDTYPEQINDSWVITCEFEGLNKLGQPFKTKERAIIGFGGSGVDASNPIENASTSAVGRALSHGGYGNIGSGLSSFEDIYIAMSRQKALEKLQNERKPSGSVGSESVKGNSDSQGRGEQASGQTGGQGVHGRGGQQMQGRSQSSQGSGHTPSAGNRSQTQQQHSQSQSGRSNDQPNAGNGQRQDNSKQEEQDLHKNKTVLVGRLMKMSEGWPQADLKAKVSQWLNFNWNGRFNALDAGQLRLVEEHMKEEIRNSQAS
ncbi:hypothetical protein [Paenibacillus gansuensis]|uniref:Uncharacterized protein n=1 Tax=Paenibacillus gansuensis TaxID=306542 RepID=A0ABW5PJ36_9BACL